MLRVHTFKDSYIHSKYYYAEDSYIDAKDNGIYTEDCYICAKGSFIYDNDRYTNAQASCAKTLSP